MSSPSRRVVLLYRRLGPTRFIASLLRHATGAIYATHRELVLVKRLDARITSRPSEIRIEAVSTGHATSSRSSIETMAGRSRSCR